MDYVSTFVAQEVVNASTEPKTLKFHSRGQDLTLSVPVEFIWFLRSVNHPESPRVQVKLPRSFCGTSTRFRDGVCSYFVGKYTWTVNMGSEENDDSPILTYVEFSVSVGNGSVEVKVVRCSEDEKIKVLEYCERYSKFDPSAEVIDTRSEESIYSLVKDERGNTFEVVDNRNIISDTRDLLELRSLIENQKPMDEERAREIMNTGFINSLLGI